MKLERFNWMIKARIATFWPAIFSFGLLIMIIIMHAVAYHAGHLDIVVDGKRISFVTPPISFTGNHWPEYGIYAFGCCAAVYAATTYANSFRRAMEDGLRVLFTKAQEEPGSPPHAHEWVVSRHEVTVGYQYNKSPPRLSRKPVLLLSYIFLHVALLAFVVQAICPAQKDSLQLLGSQCREAVNYKAGAPLLFPNQDRGPPISNNPFLADLHQSPKKPIGQARDEFDGLPSLITSRRLDVDGEQLPWNSGSLLLSIAPPLPRRRLEEEEPFLGLIDHAPPGIIIRDWERDNNPSRTRGRLDSTRDGGSGTQNSGLRDGRVASPPQIEDRWQSREQLPLRVEEWLDIPPGVPVQIEDRVEPANDLPEQMEDRMDYPALNPDPYESPLDAVSRRPIQIEDRVDQPDRGSRRRGWRYRDQREERSAADETERKEGNEPQLPTKDKDRHLQSDNVRHWINRLAVLDPSRGIRHNPINIEVSPDLIFCPDVTQIKATVPTMIHAAGAIAFFSAAYISMNLLTLYLIIEHVRVLYRGKRDPLKCRELSFYVFEPSLTSIVLKLLLAVIPLFRPLEYVKNDILRHVSLIDYAGLNQRLAVGCVMLFIITLGLEIEGVKTSFFNATN